MRERLVAPILVIVTLAVYWPVQHHGFLTYDDDAYVYDNVRVRAGLTPANILWALTATEAYNWHPVTWISHMADVEIYGLDAGGHHRTNLLLHLANVALLFLLLRRATARVWESAFAAAVFALHPLHVESVAWIAERKDLLSTLFLLLTLVAYLRYAKRPGSGGYFAMLTLYALGLMSKPMLVTLPLLMLLLDYWPLTRWGSRGLPPARLLREKLPFFLMAAASCVVTLAAQQSAGAVMKLEGYPIGLRFANAAVSYFRYLGKMIWPARLALPYPYPDSGYEWWVVAGTILALAAISWAAVRLARSAPYLLAGWIWYLVSLVPVIGLVQVGGQAMADRYTYIPLIGPLIAAAWGVPACADRIARRLARPGAFRLGIAAAGLTVVAACSVLTRVQTGYWRNGITLFTHSLAVTDRNYLGHNHLGVAWDAAGDPDRAAGEYREALEIAPDYALAHYNLGRVLAEKGDIAGAIAELQDSIRLFPGYYRAYHNLGYALGKTGRIEEALDAYKSAIRLEPRSGESHYNLAIMLYAKGRYAAAWEEILLARRYGYSPLPEFLKALEAKMPPPDQPRK